MSKDTGHSPLLDVEPLLDAMSVFDGVPIKETLERNPYGVVAAAVGIGFVLGGGLFTRLTGRIVGAVFRVGLTAALPFLQEELLASVTGNLPDTQPPGHPDGDGKPHEESSSAHTRRRANDKKAKSQ